MSTDRKIKTFSDFKMDPKMRKLLSSVVAEGVQKGILFFKDVKYEIHVYYTPFKKKIFDVKTYGLDKTDIVLPFKQGDDLSKAMDWFKENNCVIKMHNDRTEF